MPTTMREPLERLKEAGGDDWHEKFAREMTEEEEQKLQEGINAKRKKRAHDASGDGEESAWATFSKKPGMRA